MARALKAAGIGDKLSDLPMPRKEYSRLSIALAKVPKSLVAQELAVRLMLFMGELCHSRWFYYYDEAIAAFAELGD